MIEKRTIILNQTHNMRGEVFRFRKFYKPRQLFINIEKERTEKISKLSSKMVQILQKYLKGSVSLCVTISSVIIKYSPIKNENMTKKLISEIINIFDMVIE